MSEPYVGSGTGSDVAHVAAGTATTAAAVGGGLAASAAQAGGAVTLAGMGAAAGETAAASAVTALLAAAGVEASVPVVGWIVAAGTVIAAGIIATVHALKGRRLRYGIVREVAAAHGFPQALAFPDFVIDAMESGPGWRQVQGNALENNDHAQSSALKGRIIDNEGSVNAPFQPTPG